MTFLYREEPFFNQTCTLLHLLMDIENAVWQWRCEYLSRDILVASRAVHRSSSGSDSFCEYLSTCRYILDVSRAVHSLLSSSGDVSTYLETFWS